MKSIGRREVLVGMGAGTVGLAAVGLPATAAAADEGEGSGSLLGGWLITHTSDNGPAKAVVTFAGGGALVARDIGPPEPGAQLGAWKRTGEHAFDATFYDAFSEGPTGPNFIVKVIVHGTWHDDTISGTFTFTVTNESGSTVNSGSGTFSGARIVAGA